MSEGKVEELSDAARIAQLEAEQSGHTEWAVEMIVQLSELRGQLKEQRALLTSAHEQIRTLVAKNAQLERER